MQQSTALVDNFVGKTRGVRCQPLKIKSLDRLPQTCAGKNDLKNKRLWLRDSPVTLPAARQPSIGAAVEFPTRMDIGLAHV
ncbi:MAG TPA: hypothetical protein VGM81_10510 [Burkholderiaceae bacterium]